MIKISKRTVEALEPQDREIDYFDEDLKAGVECKFLLKESLKTLDGKTVEGKPEYSFSSGAPTIQMILRLSRRQTLMIRRRSGWPPHQPLI